MMTNETPHIQQWENIEVERSSSEAKRRSGSDLAIADEIVNRYFAPDADTPFALEYAYHLLGDVTGKTVLDYGCGMGENSVLIASHGGKPIGVDISADLIDLAKRRMVLHEFGDYDFKVGSAHDLPMANESVDVVLGIAILHHLDLRLASREVYRVLKPGGRAIFLEPVRDSGVIRFLRSLIPYQQPDVSPYERPLTESEVAQFASTFKSYESRAFSLPFVNLIEILGASEKLHFAAIQVDGKILKMAPFLKKFAAVRVFEITK